MKNSQLSYKSNYSNEDKDDLESEGSSDLSYGNEQEDEPMGYEYLDNQNLQRRGGLPGCNAHSSDQESENYKRNEGQDENFYSPTYSVKEIQEQFKHITNEDESAPSHSRKDSLSYLAPRDQQTLLEANQSSFMQYQNFQEKFGKKLSIQDPSNHDLYKFERMNFASENNYNNQLYSSDSQQNQVYSPTSDILKSPPANPSRKVQPSQTIRQGLISRDGQMNEIQELENSMDAISPPMDYELYKQSRLKKLEEYSKILSSNQSQSIDEEMFSNRKRERGHLRHAQSSLKKNAHFLEQSAFKTESENVAASESRYSEENQVQEGVSSKQTSSNGKIASIHVPQIQEMAISNRLNFQKQNGKRNERLDMFVIEQESSELEQDSVFQNPKFKNSLTALNKQSSLSQALSCREDSKEDHPGKSQSSNRGAQNILKRSYNQPLQMPNSGSPPNKCLVGDIYPNPFHQQYSTLQGSEDQLKQLQYSSQFTSSFGGLIANDLNNQFTFKQDVSNQKMVRPEHLQEQHLQKVINLKNQPSQCSLQRIQASIGINSGKPAKLNNSQAPLIRKIAQNGKTNHQINSDAPSFVQSPFREQRQRMNERLVSQSDQIGYKEKNLLKHQHFLTMGLNQGLLSSRRESTQQVDSSDPNLRSGSFQVNQFQNALTSTQNQYMQRDSLQDQNDNPFKLETFQSFSYSDEEEEDASSRFRPNQKQNNLLQNKMIEIKTQLDSIQNTIGSEILESAQKRQLRLQQQPLGQQKPNLVTQSNHFGKLQESQQNFANGQSYQVLNSLHQSNFDIVQQIQSLRSSNIHREFTNSQMTNTHYNLKASQVYSKLNSHPLRLSYQPHTPERQSIQVLDQSSAF